MKDCGCAKRQSALNAFAPGLGDHVKLILQPVEPLLMKGVTVNSDLLKPDMKAILWLLVGAFVVPYVIKMVK